MTRPTTCSPRPALALALAALTAGLLLAPPSEAARRFRWNVDCDETSGGGGDDREHTWPSPRMGLQIDRVQAPDYRHHLDAPDHVVFHVTVWNATDRPQAAAVEVNTCRYPVGCVSQGSDVQATWPRWLLAPGERRAVLVWSDAPLEYGRHTVNIVLTDALGAVADRYHGHPIMVGESEISIEYLEVGGRKATPRRRARLRDVLVTDGVPLSVTVSNRGTAPEAISGVFVINGGTERTCGRELYTRSATVDAGGEATLSVIWAENDVSPPIDPGRHILTVIVYDALENVADAVRGVPIRVSSVRR